MTPVCARQCVQVRSTPTRPIASRTSFLNSSMFLSNCGEHVDSLHALPDLDAGVQIGHQSDCCITYFKFPGEHRLRIAGHVDQRKPGGGEPLAFCPSGKPRPLDHHHGAAVDHTGQAGDCGAQGRAVRVGEVDMNGAGVEVGVGTAVGAIDQLIGHHHGARTVFGVEAADGARAEDPSHPELAQSPHVGPVRHGVRREFVGCTVSGQERDFVLADGAYRDRGAGLAIRGVHVDSAGFASIRGLEEGVEAAAADDSEHPPIVVQPLVRPRARGNGRMT